MFCSLGRESVAVSVAIPRFSFMEVLPMLKVGCVSLSLMFIVAEAVLEVTLISEEILKVKLSVPLS